jgi:hypothetical protein
MTGVQEPIGMADVILVAEENMDLGRIGMVGGTLGTAETAGIEGEDKIGNRTLSAEMFTCMECHAATAGKSHKREPVGIDPGIAL